MSPRVSSMTPDQQRAALAWAAEWMALAYKFDASAQAARRAGDHVSADELDRKAELYARRSHANSDLVRRPAC